MLHDSLNPDQVVDAEAALEFMKEATKLASATELEDIGERLERKSDHFGALLAADSLGSLDEEALLGLLSQIFSLRRRSRRLLKRNGLETVRAELGELLHGEAPPPQRLDRFLERVNGLERPLLLSLATECLHFSQPRRYWLWTPWIWNPEAGTGALPLVVQKEVELNGATAGETYLAVGRATALVDAQGHAVGWSRVGRGLFGTDVFLACVYAVYMYTVFRVKLSQEFNRILPELPELVRRVLGVHRMGDLDGG